MNESDEDQMDAESEEENMVVVSDGEEEEEVMDESELMETDSVADDEELSEGGPKEGAHGDAEMQEDMDSADEAVEEIVMDETETEVVETHDEVEEVFVVEDEHGNEVLEEEVTDDGAEEEIVHDDVVEEIVEGDGTEAEEEEVVEVVDADGNVVEEIVDGDASEEEEEVVSDQGSDSSYADQVVESWHDVIEEEPEDLEAAVSALIAVVYKDEDVDVESMLRRTRLPELYKYLKQQYWYKIHTNQEEKEKAEKTVEPDMPSQIVGVDDMLKSRLQGLIADVQQLDQSMTGSMRSSIRDHRARPDEGEIQSLISSVQNSSRNLMESEKNSSMPGNSMLGSGDDDEEEEDLLGPGPAGHVDRRTIAILSAKDGSQPKGGRHHVAKYYEKAVNNRVTRVEPKGRTTSQPATKTEDENSYAKADDAGNDASSPESSSDTESKRSESEESDHSTTPTSTPTCTPTSS